MKRQRRKTQGIAAGNEVLETTPSSSSSLAYLISTCAAVFWCIIAIAVSTRAHLVMGYDAVVVAPALLEPVIASGGAFAFCGLSLAAWLVLARQSQSTRAVVRASMLLFVAGIPSGLISFYNILQTEFVLVRFYAEPLWLCLWTGFSFADLLSNIRHKNISVSARVSWSVMLAASACCTAWWYSQACSYHANFLLGFNDFGHFAQRIANTAAGRGILIETEVLPPFWDHFNPGLLVLVPLWGVWPDERLFFALQASCLSGSGLLIYGISRRLGHSHVISLFWGLAWLAQPSVGQMNLAYTYGWHPITLAIPLLLAALLCLCSERPWLAVCFSIGAMSMEEGVIVIVALFCATCALQSWWNRNRAGQSHGTLGFSAAVWLAASLLSGLIFVAVYHFSGLSDFQTGRFVALGDTAIEVLFSPLLRPSAFWGQLLRFDKFAFVASLLLPCSIVALRRGWVWLLPCVIPLGVLVVWDHLPAACLAFQYPSILLPIFWFAALQGSAATNSDNDNESILQSAGQGWGSAIGAFVTGMMLSLYVGQLPYSSPTLLDVQARTYSADSEIRRQVGSQDGAWLHDQLPVIDNDGGTVLATGRIAAHFVGNMDVETVGQFIQRRDQLSQLPNRPSGALQHFEWIALDRIERFQQTEEETAQIEREARQAGYEVVAEKFDLIILHRQAN